MDTLSNHASDAIGDGSSDDDTVAGHDIVAVAALEESETTRLTRALHWAQQGTSPEVAQERWMRRLAGQAQQRLEQKLTDEQVDDVAMVAAWVHAEAVVEGARMARKRMMRSGVLRFIGTAVGAAVGAGIAQAVVSVVVG
jgi:hypothetical protein